MKTNFRITIYFIVLYSISFSQNNTFSPYSRYGLGEMAQTTFAHNAGMGGAYIAMKPDSTMPIFINAGNPAAYALIRLTSLEVGGKHLYSSFYGSSKVVTKWGSNFAYGALGFPVARNGGAVLGIMPYSSTGYETEARENVANIGDVTYRYNGSGGLNRAFLGYGIAPFQRRLATYRRRNLNIPDSTRTLSHRTYMVGEFFSKMLSDLSIGGNANYIFGNTRNITRVIYPNASIYNNTYRERDITLGDFSASFGLQTAITVDSVSMGEKRRALKEKVKVTLGYFTSINSTIKGTYNSVAYNYVLNGLGEEIVRDTALFKTDQRGTVRLPMEQGFGIGFKKGEKLNVVADFAVTGWEDFKYLGSFEDFGNNYRIAAGVNFVPEKYAAGRAAFFKRVNYRMGASYQTGYIRIRNTTITDYFVSAGVGLPVGIGRLSSMINISAQYGVMGTTARDLVRENYWRINFGFTFSDRWFQKFRHD